MYMFKGKRDLKVNLLPYALLLPAPTVEALLPQLNPANKILSHSVP